jgi:hypothetical protein
MPDMGLPSFTRTSCPHGLPAGFREFRHSARAGKPIKEIRSEMPSVLLSDKRRGDRPAIAVWGGVLSFMLGLKLMKKLAFYNFF